MSAILEKRSDEHTGGLDSTYTISREGVRKPSASYSRVPFSAPTTHVAEHDNKVNIAEASPDDRSSGTEVVLHEEELQYERGGGGGGVCIAAANSYESLSLDDELAALFGRDWNNNLSGKAVASKVKMMVQQYERGKDGPVRTSAEHQTAVELRHPDVSSIGEAETSDFESASVTSGGSSVSGGDGGRRSVRTSSAFSEGSRDVASIERFELGAVNQLQRQQQEELAAGHNTMITININYRCDTNNPPKTSKATCGEEVGVGAKNVDIVVSAPPGQAAREGGSRKSLKSDNAIEGSTVERYVQAAVGGDVEEQELMDLEKEETEVTDGSVTNDSDVKGVELLPKDDAGTGSKMDHLAKERRRSSLTSNHHRPCYTPEDEEYHDCDDLHESTLSFYEQASSQPVTPQGQKQRSSPVECADALDGEQPMIRIVQELSEDHAEVTSTITLSKEQVREMQKTNGARRSGESVEELKRHSPREEKSSVHEKRRKSSTSSSNGAATATKKRHDRSNLQRQQRIMDDNFCNEILDSTIHFDRLLGNARSQRHQAFEREKMAVSSPSSPPARPAAEECFSDSVVGELVSSPADESFDSVMSVGKLEGKPRYSGKTVGRLMMKRLKKLQGGGRDVPPKTINTSDASTSSSLQTSGPKKPPRTFAANSPKRVSAALPTPSCPTAKEVEGSDPSDYEIGWKLDSKPRTHQVGWKVPAASGKSEAIPAQIYSMLNYSEDESRRRLIKTGNSKPAPQQQSTSSRGGTGTAKYWADGEPAGPKLDIDTVDGVKTPSRRHSTSTDFEKFVRESNVKSTPHRKSDAGSRAGDTRRRIELFLSEERQQQQQQGPERKLPGADRRRRTTGGIFERRRQQQENFLDDARRTNHEPRRRKKVSKVPSLVAGGSKHACCSAAANAAATASLTRGNGSACSGGGKIEKRRTFRKAALLKRTRTLFEASKKKIWAIKKFETPKKLNIVSSGGVGGSTAASPSDRDPNINRNSSVKKKNSLHHKHLGYTPVHLRCKTCGSGQTEANNRDEGEEDVVVPVKSRASAQQAAPAPRALSSNSFEEENKENRFVKNERRRRSGEEVNRKSARSLNFASVPQEKRLTSSPVDQNDREASPRKTGKQLTEPKFLKTLRNLKISPKRIFRFASHSSEAALNNPSLDGESHGQGEFQSFDDLNLDSVANMGDFLSNIRKKIDGESFQQANSYRGQVAAVDVHDGGADQEDDDPIYQEISPKGNKMILNEFISSDTNKRYLMVNNNPNILYAMVEKGKSAGRLVRARSLTNVQGTASAADPTVSTTPVSKPLNNTIKSQMKPSNRRVTMSPHMERFDAVDMEESNCLYQTALTTNSTNIESLRKYNDREIEELVHSLHDNVTLSDVGTLDTETTASSSMGGNEIDHIGYDTVDLAPPPPRTLQKPASKNQTIDTVDVSELISHAPDDSLSSTSNLSPITGSLTSTKMSTTSGTAVMRNLKDKLRSSFRKSKTFIKNERQRLANYLEERTGSKSSSASSSAANSPRRRPVEQKNHFNTIGHTQSVQQSPARRRLECSEQEESDDMYRSFTEGSGSIVTAGSSMTELSSQHMSELMQQIIRQGDARKQLKQALGICRSTREFECSPELIEAERLLLVATQKETAVRNELNKIDYQTHGMTLAEGKRVGTVTLSNFEFPLKEAAVRDALFNYFYVVVCTYKHEVKATVAKERHADGRVYLRDCAIQFSNLDANYEIKVEVFVLQLRKNVKNYSFESRYHLEKDSKRPLSCPSPSKKLREAGRLLSFRSSSPKTFDFDNEFSRFKSQGFLTLTSFTLLTANGAAAGDDAPEEEKHFDATYATARTSHNTHLSTMLEGGVGDEELLAEGHSYYSATGHFQPVVCRRGDDQSVLFIAEEFKYLTLDSMAYTSNMVGTIGMSVRSEVRFDGSDIAGFLDVGEKVEGSDESITWNRRWCKMNGFMLEFWNYPQECQEKQPILYIDLVKCINERIQLADRTICSRPRTLKVEIFASRVAAGAGASCNSSGIGSFRSTTGRTTSPSCSAGDQDRDGLLRPLSPGEQQRGGGGGSTQSHNNVICYLLAADTQSDLKSWLVELNRVVKFLKEWKF
uniref:PH domain-containing protein n=1 Tax=Anopheles coluzzii TaxID=1518534 RepID=A0A8W7P5D9_ANOCL